MEESLVFMQDKDIVHESVIVTDTLGHIPCKQGFKI